MKVARWIAASIVVGYFLFAQGEGLWRGLQEPAVWAGIALLVAANGIGIQRWRVLTSSALKRQRESWLSQARTSVMGCFVNFVTPGGVSGDVVKGVVLAREEGVSNSLVLATVVWDRYLGLAGLLCVGAISLVADQGLRLPTLAPAAAVALGVGLLLIYGPTPKLASWLGFRAERARGAKAGSKREWLALRARDLVAEFSGYRGRKSALVGAFGLSVLSLSVSFMGLGAIAFGLGHVSDVATAVRLYSVLPIALVAASIPVLPGGVGTGHLAFGWVFGMIGVGSGAIGGAEVYHFYALHLAIVAALGAVWGKA